MALSSKILTTTITSATSFPVTGAGFQPKVIIVYAALVNTDSATSAHISMGAATDASNEFAVGNYAEDAAGTSNTSRCLNTAAVVAIPNTTGAGYHTVIETTTLDSDGFTLNCTTYTANVYLQVLCLGGSDLNAAVGTFSGFNATGTGQTAVSGLSFQPKAAILFSATATGANASARQITGFATASSAQNSKSTVSNDNAATESCASGLSTAYYFNFFDASGSFTYEAAFENFTSDGWTHQTVTSGGATLYAGYIALGGTINAKAFDETSATTNTTKSKNGIGFQPTCLIVSQHIRTATGGSSTDNYTPSAGFMTTTEDMGIAAIDNDGEAASSKVSVGYSGTESLTSFSDGTSATIAVRGGYSSFDPDGFTLNWSTTDGSARYLTGLTLAATAAATTAQFNRRMLMGVGL